MKPPLYVCVHVPEFSAQALLRLRPEMAKSSVAVVEGFAPLEQVCSMNAMALRLGVVRGMTRPELEMFAGVAVLHRSEAEESVARSILLEVAGAFTPRVEMLRAFQSESRHAFSMVLDMTGTSRVFGSVEQTLEKLAAAMSALKIFVQLAASANLHTAVCIAGAARRSMTIVSAGREREYLRPLPLAALNLTAQQAETFALWGLHTLGEVADLPEIELVVRMGQQGKRLRLMARGEHPHLMVPEEPVFTLEEFVGFDTAIEVLESLLFVVGPMLDQLLTRAQNRCHALASVTVKLGLDGGGDHERTIKPALPVAQRDLLLKLLHLDLQAHPPYAGVVSIFIHAEPGDRSKVQMGLFAPQTPDPMRLDITLARIAALVGEERVGRAALLDSHRPDSFKMERFAVPKSATKALHRRHAVSLRRCRPPLNLSVRHEGKRPASFQLYSRQYTVQRAYGPWRRSGDWWASEVWSCEEWDVEAKASEEETILCMITHDLLGNQWHLQALYD